MERIRISVQAGISKDSKLRMQNELNQIARSLRINIGTGNNQGLGGLSRDLTALSTNINRITANLSQMDRGLRNTTGNINGLRNNIQSTSQHTRTFAENVEMVVKKFSMWLGVASFVRFGMQSFQEAVKYIINFDTALTDLQKVTDFSIAQYEELAVAASNLGNKFAKSSIDIMKSMAEFGRIEKTVDGIKELTQAASVASNVTSLTAQEAAKAISTSLIVFKKDNLEAISAVDKFNEVQNNYKTSAEDMIYSIEKVGAAATTASVSIDQLNGMTVAMGTATGQAGNVTGTALKTIMARLYSIGEEGEQDLGKAEKAITSLGVAVRDSATGEFRPFFDILTELKPQWDEMTNVTKNNIAQIVSGKMHYSKFIGMMDNFQMAVDATNTSLSSYGSSIKENEKYVNSAAGRIQLFKNALNELWMQSLNSNQIKQLANFGTSLLNLSRSIGGLPTIVGMVVIAFSAWKISNYINTVRLFNQELARQAMQLMILSNGTMTYQQALNSLTVANNSAKTSVIGMKMALGGITIVLTLLTAVVGHYINKENELTLKMQQTIEQAKQQQSELQSLSDEYSNLKKQQSEGNNVGQQLAALQKTLIETYGEEAKSLDLVNGKYSEQIEVLTNLTKVKAEQKLAEIGMAGKYALEKTQKASTTTVFAPSYGEVEQFKKLGFEITNTGQAFKTFKGTIEEQRIEMEAYLAKLQQLPVETNGVRQAIGFVKEEYNKLNTEEQLQRESLAKTYASILDVININNKYSKETANINEKLIQYNGNLKNGTEISDAYKQSLTEEINKLEDVAKKNGDLEAISGELLLMRQSLSDSTNETTNSIMNNTSAITNNITSTEDLNEALKSTIGSIELIGKAQKELSDNNKISTSTLLDLIDKYPQLTAHIGNNKNMLKALEQTAKEEASVATNLLSQKLEASENYFNQWKKGNADLWTQVGNAYGTDVSNFNNAAKLKAQIDSELIKALGASWSSFYGSQQKAFQALKNQYVDISKAVQNDPYLRATNAAKSSTLFSTISKIDAITKAYTDVKNEIGAQVKSVSFKPVDISSSGSDSKKAKKAEKTGSAPSATVSANEKLIERDRYYSLNQELTRYNQLIQKNQALQESTKDEERIKLLEAEIKLSKQKQNILHKIANENRKEREEIVASLKKQGVKFTGTGDSIKATNAQVTIDKQIAEANKHRADKNKTVYNREKEELDKLQGQLNTFFKIQNEEIGDLQKDWINLTSTINELGVSIEELYTKQLTDSFDDFSNKTDIQNNTIGELEHQINMLGETQSEQLTKMQLYKNQINETTKLQKLYSNEIARLNELVPRNASEQELLTQQLSELSLKSQEASKNIYDLNQNIKSTTESIIEQQKTEADKMISSYLKNLTKDIQEQVTTLESAKQKEIDKYTESISLIEKEIELLEIKEDSLKEEESRQDKLLEIEKARKKLTDNKEKTVRVYKAGVGFVYESDVKQKVQDTDKLKELEIEYARWERDLSTKKQIEKKQAEIETKREEQETTTKHYEKEIEKLNTFISDQNKIFEEQDGYQIKNLENLYIALSTLDSKSYEGRLKNLNTFVADYNKELGELDLVDLAQQNTTIPIPTGTPVIPQVYTKSTQQPVTTPKVDTPSISNTQPNIINPSEDMVWVNQGVEGKKVLESVSSVEDRQKIRYDKAIQEGNITKANKIKAETEAVTKRIAMFRNEGYTGTGFNEALIKVHPEEFILNKNTVSDMLTGNISSMIGKVPGLKINPNNNTTSTHSETFNVQNINVSTNDAYDFHKNLKQIIQKR